MPRAVVLFSGGLDSMLAARALQLQGFEIEALNIRTIYTCCQATAAQAATALGVRLTVLSVDDDYLEVIRNPLYGYGRAVNPCVDCRVHMCQMARRFMEEVGACLVASGEVVGQRPMSQQRQHLGIIERRSGLRGRLLRPLSARLLPPTAAEQEGLVDRERLYGFHGRQRRGLIELGEALQIPKLPTPSTGCALAEPFFAPRVRDLLEFQPAAGRWDFELLNFGRHVRFDECTKVIVGRSADEGAMLASFAARPDAPESALLTPEDFRGPDALVAGRLGNPALAFAGALMLRWARPKNLARGRVGVQRGDDAWVVLAEQGETARSAETL
jgi:hypothetical protein